MTLVVEPYPEGPAGIQRSVTEVAQAMRDGRIDEDLRGWAVAALAKRGIDGRARPAPSVRVQAQALLDELRGQTVYAPDPGAAEWVQKPHVTLCLRNKCIPGGDCDDLTGAFGGAALSIGLRSYAVRVTYPPKDNGEERQQHILNGILDEQDNRLYIDPSSTRDVMDHVPFAAEEEWIDPLDMTSKITGTIGAELVTLGKPMGRDIYYKGGYWFEFAHGHWWMYVGGKWIQGPREPAASGIPGLGQPFERDGGLWVKTPSGVEVEVNRDAGLGVIPIPLVGEFHTVHELSNLIDALNYQATQLQTAYMAAKAAWATANPQEQASFDLSFQAAFAAWVPAVNSALAIVAAVKANGATNWDHTLALDGLKDAFDELVKAFHPFAALDRQLRRSSSYPKDNLPDYSQTPQPDAPDLELQLYQIADNGVQKIEQVAAKIQAGLETAAPYVAIVAIGLGIYAIYTRRK